VRDIIVDERATEENLNYILDLMHRYEVKAKSELVVDKYIQQAKESLELFEDNDYRKALDFLADYMVLRDR
jgi:octaprenyl-diphosphate synthase